MVSRQGTRLAYTHGAFEDRNIWRLDLADTPGPAAPPAPFIASTRTDDSAQFSTDGKRLAFYSYRTGDERDLGVGQSTALARCS